MSYVLHRPTTLDEASTLEASLGEDACFIAGGTDLVIQMRRGQKQPSHVIDLLQIPGLSGVELDAGAVTIGALTTHKDVWRDQRLCGRLEAMREAAWVVGGHQVRNIGTVGGNVANASPAADIVAVLSALDAEIILCGQNGRRAVRIHDFLLGPRRTARQVSEIISAVRFDVPTQDSATAFLKAGRRNAMEIAVVNVAVCLTADGDGSCLDARIAMGSVGPKTRRARNAEAEPKGRRLSPAAFREAGQRAMRECLPISDVRASAEYRGLLVAALVERALDTAASRIARRG
jgi:carbon-monoxide dehydrogenase medium subunit